MSYSFGIVAASKQEAKDKIVFEFFKIVDNQSCHLKDKDAAIQAANFFIDLLQENEGQNICVSMTGSLIGNWAGKDVVSVTGAALTINAYLKAI